MKLAYRRQSRALVPALQKLGTLDFDRASSPLLVLALMLSIALASVTATRIMRVERDLQPMLERTRLLAATLETTRIVLRDVRLGAAEPRIARADSLADRFHLIATGTRSEDRAQMLAYAAGFANYYVAARRAAVSVSMSLDADGSSAEDASLGYGMLRESFAAGIAAQAQAIDAARPATGPIELAAWLTLALLTAAGLLRRTAGRQEAEWPVAAQAAASDDYYVPIPAGADSPAIRLQDAVERLARKRLAASVAAARLAKRNNERQIELARTWNVPMLSVLPAEQPVAGMDVYVDDEAEATPRFGGLRLVSV